MLFLRPERALASFVAPAAWAPLAARLPYRIQTEAAEDVYFAPLPLPRPRRAFSFHDPARSACWRFFTRFLIQLLLVTPLPPEMQATLILSFSMLPSLVQSFEKVSKGGVSRVADPQSASIFPDASGNVSVIAPANSYPAGTNILITNYGNGMVASFSVLNDGSVQGRFPGRMGDRLLTVITDPTGASKTLERSDYFDAATGQTGIGIGGGKVPGPNGTELRISDGALPKAVAFKLDSFTMPSGDPKPSLGSNTHVGAGIAVTLSEPVAFARELDLVFPAPDFHELPAGSRPAKPQDAYYYVYRRTVANNKVYFEVIDQAFVDANGKVVTASPPFPGYDDSYTLGAASMQATSQFFLMWTYDPAQLGTPMPLAITGKVFRAVWDPGAAIPNYVPVPNVPVWMADLPDNRTLDQLGNTSFALTQKDGSFMLWDSRDLGGRYKAVAQVPSGETYSSVLYQVDAMTIGMPGLKFYRAILTANITVPAAKSAVAPPAMKIRVFKMDGDKRTDIDGIVVEGTPLLIGVTAAGTPLDSLTVRTEGGQDTLAPMGDPLKGDPTGADFTAPYTPGRSGSYTISATIQPTSGPPVTSTFTFRVIASGGSNTEGLPNAAPSVISARTAPQDGATDVPVGSYLEVAFTEPVRQVPGNVSLVKVNPDNTDGEPVTFTMSAIGVTDGSTYPVASLTSANTVVTSLTLQPTTTLDFNQEYRLRLSSGIVDTDTAQPNDPKALVPYSSVFTTFQARAIGTSGNYASPAIAVIEDRGYLVENHVLNGTVHIFDISDPTTPKEVTQTPLVGVSGRPIDLAGEVDATGRVVAAQGRLLVVATGPTGQSLPSNLNLFDVTKDQARWLGAVSLTHNALEGSVRRIVVRDGVAYAASYYRGLQVVDLAPVRKAFPAQGSLAYQDAVSGLSTDGRGWGTAYVQSIPIPTGKDDFEPLEDLDVRDYMLSVGSRRLVIATGRNWLDSDHPGPFVVVDPASQTVTKRAVEKAGANGTTRLLYGEAIGVGRVADKELAAIVGVATYPTTGGQYAAGAVLATLDLTADPRTPTTQAFLKLAADQYPVTDVLFKDDLVLLGTEKTVVVVSVADAQNPKVVGTITGAGGRLALSELGFVLSTAHSMFGAADPLSGVHAAALGDTTYLRRISPSLFRLADGKNSDPIVMEIGVAPSSYHVEAAEVDLYQDGNVVATLPVTSNSPRKAILPPGFAFNLASRYEAQTVINRGKEKQLVSHKKALRPIDLEFTGTKEVEVEEKGRTVLLDVAKLYDARPRVQIYEPSTTVPGTIAGDIEDDLAPVDAVLVNGVKGSVSVVEPEFPELRTVAPFISRFTVPIEQLSTTTVAPGSVVYAVDGTLVAPTVQNALGNVGWDSTWITPSTDEGGNVAAIEKIDRESVPRFDGGDADGYSFRVEVKDAGLGQADVFPTQVLVSVYTGTEDDPHVVWLDRYQDGYRSRPLFLVPETFKVPDGLSSMLKDSIAETRIKAKLGTRIRVQYGWKAQNVVTDDAIVAGATLVDDQNQPLKFVPSLDMAPVVTISSIQPYPDPQFSTRWQATATGIVDDPIAKVFPDARPRVSVNGVVASLTPKGGGAFEFTATDVLLMSETRVHAMAVSVNGSLGQDDRLVTLTHDESWNVTDVQVEQRLAVTKAPQVLKGVRVAVYGPKLDPSALVGTIEGIYSAGVGAAVGQFDQPPPSVALSFEQPEARNDGVWVYRSKEPVFPVKVPAYQLRDPRTPPRMSGWPLLPVEVGGFAEAKLTLGSVGSLTGMADVSGLEVLTPREGSIVNATQFTLPNEPGGISRAPLMKTTLKWRGLSGRPWVSLFQPSLADQGGMPLVDLSWGFNDAPRDSMIVDVPFVGGFDQNVVTATATDVAGNSFSAEAGVFAYTARMVANESLIDPLTATDVAGWAVGPGRYIAPDVSDGFDLLYRFGMSDAAISEHLRQNGLRAIAMKRNGGSLVTARRVDGKDVSVPLVVDVPDVPVPLAAGRLPLNGELMDGDQITWQDIVESGRAQEWLDTYTLTGPEEPIFPQVAARNVILQQVRERIGLPQRLIGRSLEYQAYLDWVERELAINAALLAAGETPAILRGLGIFVAWLDRFLLIEDTGLTVIRPVLGPTRIVPVGQAMLLAGERLAPGYQTARTVFRATGYDYTIDATIVAKRAMDGFSAELGTEGVTEFALRELQALPGEIVAFGVPSSGPAATDVFDTVVIHVLRDAAGNPIMEGGEVASRIYLLEAKGGIDWFDLVRRMKGRIVEIPQPGGVVERMRAMQGTREYVERTAELMAERTDNSIIRDTGRAILAKIRADRWDEIRYFFVSSKWSTRGGRVVGTLSRLRATEATLVP